MPCPCLQILTTNIKVKAKKSGFLYNVKFTEQTIHILHDSNNEYREKCKTTFTKQAKEILDTPNPKLIACTIKENTDCKSKRFVSRGN